MSGDRRPRGLTARPSGRFAAYIALVHLMLKGYRILGFRLKLPQGEIDILARKGNRLAMVEVKQRQLHETAIESVSITQQDRLWQAGLSLQHSRPRWRDLDLCIDLYTLAPGRWPRHSLNAFEKSDTF